jgi:pre-mRNA-processing factor 39
MQVLWERVRSDPSDFASWQELAKLAESSGLSSIREVFPALLEHYPLCFGYWRKWASKEDHVKALELLQQAVQHAPYVHEIWTKYCSVAVDSMMYPPHDLRAYGYCFYSVCC